GFGNGVGSTCRVADIGGEVTRVAQRARGGLAGGGVDVGDGDARPFGDEVPGDREPDAVRGAGHDRNLVLEPHAVPPEARAYSGETYAHLRRGLGVLPSPLWGGVGGGGPSVDHRSTPTPALRADPPHKGEGGTEFAARADSIRHKCNCFSDSSTAQLTVQRRPNRRSRNQPSRPRSMACGRTA